MMAFDPHTAALLAALGGAALVWCLWGAAWLRWKQRERVPSPSARAREWDLGWQRWVGLVLMMGGAGLAVPPWMLFSQDIEPYDWIFALFIGAFMGGGTLTGWLLWRARIWADPEGLWGYSAAMLPRYIAWSDLRQARYSAGMGALELTGGAKPVYVSVFIDDYQGFLRTLRERAPQAALDIDTKKAPDELMAESHYTGMEKHATKFFGVASVLFMATLPVVVPPPQVQALAAAAGACLALAPVLRRLVARSWRTKIEGFASALGLFAMITLGNIYHARYAAYLGGPDAIGALTGGVMVIQYLSFVMLTAFLLLIAAKRLWPQRFGSLQ